MDSAPDGWMDGRMAGGWGRHTGRGSYGHWAGCWGGGLLGNGDLGAVAQGAVRRGRVVFKPTRVPPCRPPPPRRPTVPQISKRMLDICAKEGLAMNQATMDALVQVGGGPAARRAALARVHGALFVGGAPALPGRRLTSACTALQSANGGDIRLILGQLQMIRLRARALTYDQVRQGAVGRWLGG